MLSIKSKKFFSISVIARLIATFLLLLSFTKQQIGFYQFLRWIVCATAIYTIYVEYKNEEEINTWLWMFGIIALLFNPVFPFYLGKSAWQVVDIGTALFFIASLFYLGEKIVT